MADISFTCTYIRPLNLCMLSYINVFNKLAKKICDVQCNLFKSMIQFANMNVGRCKLAERFDECSRKEHLRPTSEQI